MQRCMCLWDSQPLPMWCVLALPLIASSAVFWPHLFLSALKPEHKLTRDLTDIPDAESAGNTSREKWNRLGRHWTNPTLCCGTAQVALSDVLGATPVSFVPWDTQGWDTQSWDRQGWDTQTWDTQPWHTHPWGTFPTFLCHLTVAGVCLQSALKCSLHAKKVSAGIMFNMHEFSWP